MQRPCCWDFFHNAKQSFLQGHIQSWLALLRLQTLLVLCKSYRQDYDAVVPHTLQSHMHELQPGNQLIGLVIITIVIVYFCLHNSGE